MKTSQLTKLIKESSNVILVGEGTYRVSFPQFSIVVAFNPETGEDLKVGFNGQNVMESSNKEIVSSTKRILEKRHMQSIKEHKKAVKEEFEALTSSVLNRESVEDDGILDLNTITGQ